MKKLIFLLSILILFTSSIVIALQGGSANSYSTDATKYKFYHTYNFSGYTTTVPNDELGNTVTEWVQAAGNAQNFQIEGNKVYNVLDNIDGSGFKLCHLLQEERKNFTVWIYGSWNGTIINRNHIYGDNATRCNSDGAVVEDFLINLRATSPGVTLRDGVFTTSTALDKPVNIVANENYSIAIPVFYKNTTACSFNLTFYRLINQSGTLVYIENGSQGEHTCGGSGTGVRNIHYRANGDSDGSGVESAMYDQIVMVNWTSESNIYSRPTGSSSPDTTPPSIIYYNLTSSDNGCESWNTNKSTACSTSFVTPAVQFNTNEPAWCAIAGSSSSTSLDKNYTDMGSSRNCTGDTLGEGTTSHLCTLTSQDELVYDTSYVYISCKDTSANNNQNRTSTSDALSLSITGLESAGRNSIGIGIQNALLSGYTNYTDLQIYARNLSNAQVKGTFDRVAKKGSKMWAFNRIGVSDSYVNMFNLTPVLYTLEFANKTSEYITNQTERLINATK